MSLFERLALTIEIVIGNREPNLFYAWWLAGDLRRPGQQ